MAMMDSDEIVDVLVVDDEPEVRDLLIEYFERYGLKATGAESAQAARRLVEENAPPIAILDVQMPGEDGLSLARWLREHHSRMGIVFLTSAGDPVDRIVGLEIGADDYVSKPFDLRELLARVKSLQRRLKLVDVVQPQSGGDRSSSAVAFGECLLQLGEKRLVGPSGEEIAVTAAEFELLELFARSPNRPLSRDQIMEQTQNRDWNVFDRSVDLRIMRLRRKIERNPDKPEVIKTIRNVGYVFVKVI